MTSYLPKPGRVVAYVRKDAMDYGVRYVIDGQMYTMCFATAEEAFTWFNELFSMPAVTDVVIIKPGVKQNSYRQISPPPKAGPEQT